MDTVLAFLALLLPLTLSPGPATIALAGLGMSQGVARAMPFFCGLLISVLIVLVAAGFGLAELFLRSAVAYEVVRWAGIAYVAWLGVKFLRARPLAQEAAAVRAGLGDGMLLTLLNPKFYAMVAAVFSQFLVPGSGGTTLPLIAGMLAVLAGSQFVWLAAGAGLRPLLCSARAQRVQCVVSGLLLLAVALWLALRAAPVG